MQLLCLQLEVFLLTIDRCKLMEPRQLAQQKLLYKALFGEQKRCHKEAVRQRSCRTFGWTFWRDLPQDPCFTGSWPVTPSNCSENSLVLLVDRSGKSPESPWTNRENPGKIGKVPKRTKQDKKGRTSPDRETPPFETPPFSGPWTIKKHTQIFAF